LLNLLRTVQNTRGDINLKNKGGGGGGGSKMIGGVGMGPVLPPHMATKVTTIGAKSIPAESIENVVNSIAENVDTLSPVAGKNIHNTYFQLS
jgi:hypothetical protein